MIKTHTLDDYIITKDGQIINKHRNRPVKGQPNGKGYLRVSIGKKLMFVHRLVAEAHVPNPENKPQVNHKDGNKLNNRADNLEWVTNNENRRHAVENKLHLQGEQCSWAKLTQKDVDDIRADKITAATELAKKYGVTSHTIRDVRKYRSWKNS